MRQLLFDPLNTVIQHFIQQGASSGTDCMRGVCFRVVPHAFQGNAKSSIRHWAAGPSGAGEYVLAAACDRLQVLQYFNALLGKRDNVLLECLFGGDLYPLFLPIDLIPANVTQLSGAAEPKGRTLQGGDY